MNDYCYGKFILPYLELKHIHILNRNQKYLLGLKKRSYYKKTYTQIFIHLGSPCFRYCICKHLLGEDWNELYNYYLDLAPSLNS